MSRNSRRPSKVPSVDESLFGTSSARRATTPPSATVNTSTLNKLLADPSTETDSIVISRQEIEKMKMAARLADDKEFEHAKHAQTLAKEEQMSKAKARKEKMIALEQAQRSQAPELTEFEQEAIRRKSEILGNAKASLDEQHDDVKHMNQMMLYAQCVTIRDQQLAEKTILLKEKQEEQRRLDQEMDEFRRKKLKEVEEREVLRTQEQKKGASVIVAQMKEREIERIRARELKEQEAQQILEQIKEREQKEAEERLIKAEEGRKLLQIIMAANNEQAQAKNAKKKEALEEDQRIAEYLKMKHQKEAEKEAELAAKKAEKEREIARLRAMQEKAYDRQAELDAIRARRYQEALERKQRQKDLEEARKREQSIEDIKRSHEQQQHEAHQRKAEQLLQEKAEYERILASQQEYAERTANQAKSEQMERTMHRQELLGQITDHEKAKTEKRRHFVEEGRKLTDQLAQEQARLEAIKAAKLAQLEKLGVPEKYRAELAKKKVLQSKLT